MSERYLIRRQCDSQRYLRASGGTEEWVDLGSATTWPTRQEAADHAGGMLGVIVTPMSAVLAAASAAASDRQEGGDHYRRLAVQPWDAMAAWMTPEAFRGFLRGNAIKYLARCDAKGGVEDLRKARHYLDRLIELESQP